MKTTSKDQRNQNIADAFYQGGHSQTAIALAFGVPLPRLAAWWRCPNEGIHRDNLQNGKWET